VSSIVRPISCQIDSRLGTIADQFRITVAEYDDAAPGLATASLVEGVGPGSEIVIRLGIEGQDPQDYGAFLVDAIESEHTERSTLVHLSGRGLGARLVDNRAAAAWGMGSNMGLMLGGFTSQAMVGGLNPTAKAYPTLGQLAAQIGAAAGIDIVWGAPSYSLTEFHISPMETCASALSRLLTPLQQSVCHRADAHIRGGACYVQRRGTGPVAGTIDCRLGLVTRQGTSYLPAIGPVTVDGASYVFLEAEEKRESSVRAEDGAGTVRSDVARSEPDAESNQVSLGATADATGQYKEVSQKREDQQFQEIWGDHGDVIGRALIASTVEQTVNPGTADEEMYSKRASYGYTGDWALCLRDESSYLRDTSGLHFKGRAITHYDQITPAMVRTTVTALDENAKWKSESVTEAPGVLESVARIQQDPTGSWGGDALAPTKKSQFTLPFTSDELSVEIDWEGTCVVAVRVTKKEPAVSGSGTAYKGYSEPTLIGNEACSAIAQDIADDSQAAVHTVTLRWPRPFPYFVGERLYLTHRPGGLGDITLDIVAIATEYDLQAHHWVHTVELEGYSA